MLITSLEGASTTWPGSNVEISGPATLSPYLKICWEAGALAGPLEPVGPVVDVLPQLARIIAARQSRVGRNPMVNFLPDLMGKLSLLCQEQ
jgi:hypothetical protein